MATRKKPAGNRSKRSVRRQAAEFLPEKRKSASTEADNEDLKEQGPTFELTASRQFESWLAEVDASLAFTTYLTGKLFFLGRLPDGRLAVFNRTLQRGMGIATAGQSLYVSTLYQIIRFHNGMEPGQKSDDGYDAAYVPQAAYFTGDLDIHDLAVDGLGRLIFVNTLFSCLAAASDTVSFVPIWRPPFISRLAAEDRCHLNGMALRNGALAYATAVSDTDVGDGWRDNRVEGGIVVDTVSNEIVACGLSMPHSPRVHDGRLWLLDSGTGRFGYIDTNSGEFEEIAFCPGYARGLTFIGDYAVVGLSKPRDNKTFGGLPLDGALARRKVEPRCGLIVVDLKSGDTVHWVRIEGIVNELYDVTGLLRIRNPMAIGFRNDEIRRVISLGGPEKAIRISAV